MASDDVHGTWRGLLVHRRIGEHLCAPCAAYAADKARSHNIVSGKHKSVCISIIALARILRGWDVDEVLATEMGPLTLNALRNHRAGEQR